MTKDSPRLPLGRKLSWAVGGFGGNLMANGVTYLGIPIYSVALGVNPALVGLALGLPRLWQAVLNPLMGNMSDNTRSKWGRRRPYIAVGAILTGILFAIMWMPPAGLGPSGLFTFFVVISILYYTCYTVFVIPYGALGFELSTDYNERTRIMALRTFFSTCSGLLLPWAYKLSFRPEFGNSEAEGVRVVGVMFGLAMLVSGVIPAIFARENPSVQRQPKINLVAAFKYTVTDRQFLLIAGSVFSVIVGIFLVQPMGLYMGIYYLYEGDKEAAATLTGIGGTVFAIMGLLSIPIASYLGTHLGKKRTLLLAEGLVIASYLATWFLYTPENPYLSLICLGMLCPGTNAIWIIASSMLADICDSDEVRSGRRREGMLGAVYMWVVSGALAGSLTLSGYLIALTGVDSELAGLQRPESIFWMRVLFALVPAVGGGIALLLASAYGITEKRARETRQILEERKLAADEQKKPFET